MKIRVALIGGGGLAREILETAQIAQINVIGIFAEESSIADLPHLGYLDDLLHKRELYDAVHIAFGGMNLEGIQNRLRIIEFLQYHTIPAVSIISPHAIISPTVSLQEGCYIAHQCIISSNTSIAAHTIVNMGSIIGHDVSIGSNTTLSPRAFIGGSVTIRGNTLIGAGSLVKQGLNIGEYCIVGMGCIMTRSLEERKMIIHNLSRPIAVH